MAQDWADSIPTAANNALSDITAIRNNFACLKGLFSGADAPSNPVAGMPWFHTAKIALKLRNNANDAWLGIMQADASHKIWVYRNTAPDGWAIDSAVADRVLALKGGSGAYNVNGGTEAGSWTQPDGTLTVANLPAHDHGEGAGHTHGSFTANTGEFFGAALPQSANVPHTHNSVGSGTAHNHGTSYRPYAAVGTLQYMDL